ncbi:MAG: hypothetical protein RhofKO_14200 [Rhodothermales bacterium]
MQNATRTVAALNDFGFGVASLAPALFLNPNGLVRLGRPPLRIEFSMSIPGVEFGACYAERNEINVEGMPVDLISLACLRRNKQATGRHKDRDDLQHLP